MRKLFAKLWNDDGGAIISIELLFIVVILVIGLIAGWTALRDGIVYEFASLGNAVALLDCGYYIAPVASTSGYSDGTWVTHGFTNPNATAITTPIGLQTINTISSIGQAPGSVQWLDTPGVTIGGTSPVLPIP